MATEKRIIEPLNQEVILAIDAPIDLSTLTEDDLKRECKESLALMVRHAKGDLKALGAVRELLDRLEGKPIARTDINVRSQAILVIEASGD